MEISINLILLIVEPFTNIKWLVSLLNRIALKIENNKKWENFSKSNVVENKIVHMQIMLGTINNVLIFGVWYKTLM